ncbi:MAG: DUF2723 domain-containing protein [Sandaracinaceae bacterium]|nr:DUF2723 domain-containing protein [Sandaracinaceae bacterium]
MALLVFLYDLATLGTDLGPYDSSELALVAVDIGLSHPIGQPLHTLLGIVWVRLWGWMLSPLTALALMSSLFHSLTAIPAMALATSEGNLRENHAPWLAGLVIAGALLLPPLWDCGTRVEVYALSAFGFAWALAWMEHREIEPERKSFGAGLGLGLTFSANAYHGALLGGITALRIAEGKLPKQQPALTLWPLLKGFGLGLLPYTYVPAIAWLKGRGFIWGDPSNFERLLAYFQGEDYERNRGTTLTEFGEHLVEWFRWSASGPILWLLLLGGIAIFLIRKERPLSRFDGLVLGTSTACLLCSHRIFHPEIADYQNYLGPAILLGSTAIANRVAHFSWKHPRARTTCTTLAITLFFLQSASSPPFWARSRGRDRVLGHIVREAIEKAPPQAFVLIASDHWVAPLLYVQLVEKRRADIALVPLGLAASSWFWRLFFEQHPDLQGFPLQGAGGRMGRIQRLLNAHPERPILVESGWIAQGLGLGFCEAGWWLLARPCPAPDWLRHSISTQATPSFFAQSIALVDAGSPPTHEILAALAIERAQALWQLGRHEEALRVLDAASLPRYRLGPWPPSLRAFPFPLPPLPACPRSAPILPPLCPAGVQIAGLSAIDPEEAALRAERIWH